MSRGIHANAAGIWQIADDQHLDLGTLEAMVDDRREFAHINQVRESARTAFVKEDLSRRVAKAIPTNLNLFQRNRVSEVLYVSKQSNQVCRQLVV